MVIANKFHCWNENMLVGFLGEDVGNFLKSVGLRVIAEKMKIWSYLHVGKNL